MSDLITRIETAEAGSRELSDEVLLALPNGDGLDLDEMRHFLQRIRTTTGCWFLNAKTDAKGRTRLYPKDRRKLLAHRAMWSLINGPIPKGMLICHHCDVPGCVNPKHIYCGTYQDNARDAVERGRTVAAIYPDIARAAGRKAGLQNTWTRGEDHPRAKISGDQADEIRASKEPTRFLVAKHGLARSTIQKIRRRELWRHNKGILRAKGVE